MKSILTLTGVVTACLICGTVTAAMAAHINIVAIGDSAPAGTGVGPGGAYPAQLEAMLRAKGYDVSITNAGIPGNTSSDILSTIDSAVPDGTKIVLLRVGYYNEARLGISRQQRQQDLNGIMSRLHARRIKVIMVDIAGISSNDHQPDGRHLNLQGHAVVAARLLPQVTAAIGGR